MGEDPSIGEALFGMLLAGAWATAVCAAVGLPVVGLLVWAGAAWKRNRRHKRRTAGEG